MTYEKTQDLARDLRGVGCGDLDVEGIFLNFSYSVRTVAVKQSLKNETTQKCLLKPMQLIIIHCTPGAIFEWFENENLQNWAFVLNRRKENEFSQ